MSNAMNRLRSKRNALRDQMNDIQIHGVGDGAIRDQMDDDIQIRGVSASTINQVGTGLQAITEVLATAQQGKQDAANKKAATDARAAATTADNAAQLAAMTAAASPTLANQQAALVAQQNATTLDAAASAAEAKAGVMGPGQYPGGPGQGQYPGAPGQGQYPGGPPGPKKPTSIWIPVAVGAGVLGVGFLLYRHFSNPASVAQASRGYSSRRGGASS